MRKFLNLRYYDSGHEAHTCTVLYQYPYSLSVCFLVNFPASFQTLTPTHSQPQNLPSSFSINTCPIMTTAPPPPSLSPNTLIFIQIIFLSIGCPAWCLGNQSSNNQGWTALVAKLFNGEARKQSTEMVRTHYWTNQLSTTSHLNLQLRKPYLPTEQKLHVYHQATRSTSHTAQKLGHVTIVNIILFNRTLSFIYNRT